MYIKERLRVLFDGGSFGQGTYLKKELLQAMEGIDDLYQANQVTSHDKAMREQA